MTATSQKPTRICRNFIAAVTLLAGMMIISFGARANGVECDPTCPDNVTGAIFTTDALGVKVNGNIYDDCCDVYLNGGPNGPHPCANASAGLPDGCYYFQVTDPAGSVLLSCDDISQRAVLVQGGFIVAYLGTPGDGTCTHCDSTTCKGGTGHNTGIGKCQNDGVAGNISVQLMPFCPTPNPGGEYKLWMTPVGCYDSTAGAANFGFSNEKSKTDNFKCGDNVACEGTCISCPVSFTVCVDDFNGDPTKGCLGIGAVVDYSDPIVVGGRLLSCDPPSGSFFCLGTTPVTCTATNDDTHASATCSDFKVTVSNEGDCGGGNQGCIFNVPTVVDLGCNPTSIPTCSDVSLGTSDTCSLHSFQCQQVALDYPQLGTSSCSLPTTAAADDVQGCVHKRRIVACAIGCDGAVCTYDQTFTWTVVTRPVFASCPAGRDLGCNPTSIPTCASETKPTASNECGAVDVTCDAGTDSVDGCHRSRTLTYTATACGLSQTCRRTFTWTVVTRPVFASCPAGRELGCNPTSIPTCASETKPTASNECGPVEVTCDAGTDSVDGCHRSRTLTYTATACGLSQTCMRTFTWTADTEAPTIKCPPDVTTTGAVPAAATTVAQLEAQGGSASDNCGTPTITSSDKTTVSGCATVIERTYTATDGCGKTAKCTQRITTLPGCLVTNTERCCFDCNTTAAGQQFRLIFTQDPNSPSCYKLNASNPGQFFYNVFQTGTPGTPVSLTITLPYPFVTQGNVPVHVYDAVTVYGASLPLDGTCPASTCLTPGNDVTPAFTIAKTAASVTCGSASGSGQTITVTGVVPASGVAFVAVHVDYGFKGCTGYNQDANGNAVVCGSTTVLIPNNSIYSFSASGTQTCDSTKVQSFNVFKKNPGVGGGSNKQSLVDGVTVLTPVPNCAAVLSTGSPATTSNTLVKTTTDQDGYYMCTYKYTGKATTLYVTLTPPGGKAQTKSITIKSNGFVQLDFLCP